MKQCEQPDETSLRKCIYTPHSLRTTTATLLLGAGVDINKVRGLLGHRHLTTTQIYDKRRITASQNASADLSKNGWFLQVYFNEGSGCNSLARPNSANQQNQCPDALNHD